MNLEKIIKGIIITITSVICLSIIWLWCNYWFSVDYQIIQDQNGEYAILHNVGGLRKNINIKSEYKGVPVTHIGDSAFSDCDNLKNVTIPDNVTSIGDYAFYSCDSLTNIEIPDSVTSIGDYAFSNCDSLTSIEIPNSVTSIGDHAFYRCDSLTSIGPADSNASVKIPNSVTSIGVQAFSGCENLTSVTIPDSVTSIGFEAFHYCSSLTSVVIPESVTSIGNGAFSWCCKLVEVINHSSLDITAGSEDYGDVAYYALEVHTGESKIVNKDGYLFYTYDGVNYLLGDTGNDTDIILPDNYNGESYVIYEYAFYRCISLTSVVIPDSVTSIGKYTFANCTRLTSITVAENNTAYKSIDGNLYEINEDGTPVTLVQYAVGKADPSFTVPDSVTSISDYAFSDCHDLTSVTIGNSVTSIGKSAFQYCTRLTSVTIPDSVTSISDSAFSNCWDLKSVTIGNSVMSIGNWAFSSCDSLTSIEIPNSVTSIGNGAFSGCDSLTDVYYTGTEEEWLEIVLGDFNSDLKNATIHYNYVPEE